MFVHKVEIVYTYEENRFKKINKCFHFVLGIDSDIEEAIDTSHDNVLSRDTSAVEHNSAPSPVLPPIPSNLTEQ